MQAKFILCRPDGTRAQVAITADASASVADLADALLLKDPDRRERPAAGPLTLKVESAAYGDSSPGRVLDPARSLIDSGLRSGSMISVTAAKSIARRRRHGRTVAVLRVLEGPDTGSEFPLTAGNSTIGTGMNNDVTLTDRGVADIHAALTVGETIEIVNLTGPSGVRVSGQAVQRAHLGANDVVHLGGTAMTVLHTVRPGATQPDNVAIEFNRPPRVVSRFDVQKVEAPKPPSLPEPTRFPVISMLAPLVMGVVLFAVTRSMLAVLFIALSPLLMLGMYVDTTLQARKKYRQDCDRFSESLRSLADDLTARQKVERAVRLAEAPALDQVVKAAHRLDPLLWTHRPEHAGFLTVRLGLGDAPSRCRIQLPDCGNTETRFVEQLTALHSEFDTVDNVPIVAGLRECGALGICGGRGVVDGVARGIVMQLVGLHSPADLTLTAFSSSQSRASWEWLEWLPHTGSVHSPLSGNHLTDSINGGQALLSRLEDLVRIRGQVDSSSGVPDFGTIDPERSHDVPAPAITPAVVVLVEDSAPIDRSRLTRLAEQGAAVGVHVIWIANHVSGLPAACRTFVMIDNESEGATVGQVRHGQHVFPVACDSIAVADARQVALLMAPLVDVGAAVADVTDLPRSVSYLTLTGARIASDPNAVVQQWLPNDPVRAGNRSTVSAAQPGTLRALVGSTGAEQFHLDLREHGPHALVGGTTGSGKSEFLQSWIIGMATAHSPDRVNFLLVDYKGGTAFADCVGLPHTVGLVTDLSPHLVRRALTSLGAEIRRREELLNRKRAKDLISLEQTGDPETPPSLVIIVDEFAALATEMPEFVDGVIDVAQRGRSLGLHLVLATQRPAGVIRDNLRANTNLRIALRLNDVEDSVDVIDDPLAAQFPPEIPGRAVARTGPGRLTTFQAAYVGGRTGDQPDQTPIDVTEFVFGRSRPWQKPHLVADSRQSSGPTDIARTVASIRAATDQLRIPPPRRPWLPPLEPIYALEDLPSSPSGVALTFGTCDIPARQAQPLVEFSPDDEGNIAVIGTGGSGKSTALRSLAMSAALNPAKGPAHIYGLDFASGSLRMLEPLPNVAAVATADDEERIGRILRRLKDLLEDRSRRFSAVSASTLTEYRKLVDPDEPRILLLLDGIGPFRDRYETFGPASLFGILNQIASDGRAFGIHLIISADRPSAIPPSLASTIQRRLILRLASEEEYAVAGIAADIMSATSPQGRGVLNGVEVQVAVLGGDPNVAVQDRAIAQLAEAIKARGFTPPAPVQTLSELIDLAALPVSTPDLRPVIGVEDSSLQPIGIPHTGLFTVAGAQGSGRSTALLTLAHAMCRHRPDTRTVHLSPGPSSIARQPVWTRSACGDDAVTELTRQILADARPDETSHRLMIVIEDIGNFAGTGAEAELVQLVKTLGGSALIVGESETSTWSQAWQLAPLFKAARRGLLLWPRELESDSLFSTSIGSVRRSQFPPGRGLVIERGRGVWMQLAQPGT